MAPLGRKGKELIGVLWFETVLAFTAIGLRWYTRKYIRGVVGWDDWILMFTWVFMAAFAVLCTVSITYGMGSHVTELTLDEIVHGVKFLLVGQVVISIAMGTSKVAVAMFLMRLVNEIWHRVVLWFWIITMMGLSLLLSISVFTQCLPVEAIWDPRVSRLRCVLDLTTLAKVMCSWSAAMDFFLAIFPWLFLWQLNMKRKEKIAICSSLSLGILAGVCGVIRTTGLDVLKNTKDYLYATSDSVMWTTSEMTLTIICVCIPALRPLYNRLTGRELTNQGSERRPSARHSANVTFDRRVFQGDITSGKDRFHIESVERCYYRNTDLDGVDGNDWSKDSSQDLQQIV